MTHRPRLAAASGLQAAATPILLAASALALAACGQHAYPGSSAPPPPPPPQADLMGAPEGSIPPGPPQAYAPAQPGLDAPAQPTVQGPYGEQTGPDGSYRPGYEAQGFGPATPSYPPGQCPPRGERVAADGCMDPIPNPPEDRPVYRRRFLSGPAYGEAYAAVPHLHRHYAYRLSYGSVLRRTRGGLYQYVPYAPGRAHHLKAASMHRGHAVAAPANITPKKPAANAPAAHAPAPAAHTSAAKPSGHGKGANSAKPTLKAPVVAGEAGAAAAALATALTPVVKAHAVLHADGLQTGRPGDVTLTLPADFADTLRDRAKSNGLTDAAASANLTAALTGDGYTVSPSDPQSQPLTAGQATTFKWTVTPQPSAKGALHAQVGADLLGGGVQHVDLGGVDEAPTAPFKLSAQTVGWILLAVIGLALLGLVAARGGRRPVATGAVRPRSGVNGSPPLSLDETRR